MDIRAFNRSAFAIEGEGDPAAFLENTWPSIGGSFCDRTSGVELCAEHRGLSDSGGRVALATFVSLYLEEQRKVTVDAAVPI